MIRKAVCSLLTFALITSPISIGSKEVQAADEASQEKFAPYVEGFKEKIAQNEGNLKVESLPNLKEKFNGFKAEASFQAASVNGKMSNVTRENVSEHVRSYRKQKPFTIQSMESIDLTKVNDRRILLKLNDEEKVDLTLFGQEVNSLSKRLIERNFRLIQVPQEKDYHHVLQELQQAPGIESAEPDYLKEVSYQPADPKASSQWYLKQIQMPAAWDVTKGSQDVTVAVLDSGVNPNHPDLEGRVLSGYDFGDNDSNPMDENGHGTHVAGIIAANTNTIGIAGMDLNAKILPVKVGEANGYISTSAAVDGIYYAMEQGADVINMSYGSYYDDEFEEEALWEAYDQGIVLVAAAGNESTDEWSYPASYPQVISVGASTESDQRASFSNWGTSLDLTAPGENILSTSYQGGYGSKDGTSFSAPIVSGAAALLKAYHPTWGPREIEWALENGAEGISGEWNSEVGFGRLNVYEALNSTFPSLQGDAPDLLDQAESLSLDQSISEKIDVPLDLDWFTFEVEQGSEVSIQLSQEAAHIDLVGNLLKFNGDDLVYEEWIDSGDMGESESYTFEASPGTYHIAVYDYYNHWSKSNYSIDVSSSPIVGSGDPELYEEVEPNDSLDLADSIPYGALGAGYFQYDYDYDYFQMDLPSTGDLIITTAVDYDANDNDPIALLMDQDGDVIDISDGYSDYDYDLKYNFEYFENVASGSYYILLLNYYEYADSNPYLFDVSYLEDDTVQPAVPTVSVESGTYYKPIHVALSAESGAKIKYTLNGSVPSEDNGYVYTGPLEIKQDTTLKTIAIKDGVTSNVVTREYKVKIITPLPPTASHKSGEYEEAISVELTKSYPYSSMIYTLDGTKPTLTNGKIYEDPILINESSVLKAIEVFNEKTSSIASYVYKLKSDSSAFFPDAEGHWAQKELYYLADNGLLSGYRDGTVGANKKIVRAEAAAIIARELGLSEEATASFNDVSSNHWASKVIAAANKAGVMGGYAGNIFKPDAPLTREEMASILVRAYELSGKASVSFTDVKANAWSYAPIQALVANKITAGYPDGTFRPQSNITRAEFSVLLARVINENLKLH